jgi:hypothetical protein
MEVVSMGQKLMRYAPLILVLVLVVSFSACAREQGPAVQWSHIFDTGSAFSAQQTADGNYMVYGRDMWGNARLLKLNENGEELWDKLVEGTRAVAAQQTVDGGYIMCGMTASSKTKMGDYLVSTDDVWLLKADADGNKLWDKIYGGEKDDGGNSIQQTTDGGYIICGTTASYGVSNEHVWGIDGDIWLIKTDADGNKLWDKTFGGERSDEGDYVQQTTDGGYIVCGKTVSDQSYPDIRLIKTDADGNQLWERTFEGISLSAPCSPVQQTTDGGYVLCGDTHGGSLLIKTDATGNELWRKTIEEDEPLEAYSVQQTSDGGYVLCGMVYGESLLPGPRSKILILRTDVDGNRLWYKTFGGKYLDKGVSVQQTADGGYILCGDTGGGYMGIGETRPHTYKPYEAWLIKIAPER